MKKAGFVIWAFVLMIVLSGCSVRRLGKDAPALPEPQNTTSAQAAKASASPGMAAADLVPGKLKKGEDGVPVLRVYDVKAEKIIEESVEEYVPAVLAGEMAGDWPQEALKAQAILARTFVLQFVTEKTSRYEGADISTDIEEAQAYNADAVNDRIRQAVSETRGLVLSAGGKLPYAWFHAHSGGLTARAKEGLDYEKDEPGYTQCVKGMENDEAPPEAASWQAAFTMDEVIAAMADVGAKIDEVTSVTIGQRGESGRAMTLIISGKEVSAPALRIALGSTKMRSCLLESLRVEDHQVKMQGRGYGHGVGMSQWGAYAMAKEGKTAEEIVTHYFRNVRLDQAWE